MEDIQRRLNELSDALVTERTMREQAEARSVQAESRLAAIEASHNASHHQRDPPPVQPAVPQMSHHESAPVPKGPKVATPDKFSGARGSPAEIFATQVQLYMLAHPGLFPNDRSKVVFTLSYLTGAASSWAQPMRLELFDNSTSLSLDPTFSPMVQDVDDLKIVSLIFLSCALSHPLPASVSWEV